MRMSVVIVLAGMTMFTGTACSTDTDINEAQSTKAIDRLAAYVAIMNGDDAQVPSALEALAEMREVGLLTQEQIETVLLKHLKDLLTPEEIVFETDLSEPLVKLIIRAEEEASEKRKNRSAISN